MLPNFVIAGTAKSGTNTIKEFLEGHPECGFCSLGEPDFFAKDELFARGLSYYKSLFAGGAGKKILAEKSWRYSVPEAYPKAQDRLFAAIPDVKILYIVRNPLERAATLWRELRDNGGERIGPDFEKAVFESPLIFFIL